MQPAQLYFFLYLSKLNSPETSPNVRVSHFLPRVGHFTPRVCQFLIRVIFFIPRVCHFNPRWNNFLPRVDDFNLRGRRFPPRGWRFTRADGLATPNVNAVKCAASSVWRWTVGHHARRDSWAR